MLIDIDMPKDITVELDADSLVYRVACVIDMLGEGKEFACKSLDRAIELIYEDTGCRKCNIYLGTNDNFRNDIATLCPYKGNRDNSKRPMFYEAIRGRLCSEYGAQLCHGQEAEDSVGIAAYGYIEYNQYIIGAIDKDMLMIAGHHYNYATRKMQFVDTFRAMRQFYLQLVTGDKAVDNIPGVYHQLLLDGEEERAHKFRYSRYKSALIATLAEIDNEMDMYDHVCSIYDQEGLLDKHGIFPIIEIGRLLWIRRQEEELWVPPTERNWDYINNDTRNG